jgi:hypothetical protein
MQLLLYPMVAHWSRQFGLDSPSLDKGHTQQVCLAAENMPVETEPATWVPMQLVQVL